MQNTLSKAISLPDSLLRFLQEYTIESLDLNTHANTIIERTLEMGTWKELHWLFHNYGVQRIIDYIRHFGHRRLTKRTFNYWCKLLNIQSYRKAPWSEIRDDVWVD
jgi:hypothetical protein